MFWLPYVIAREMYLQSIREYAKFHHERVWAASHGASLIPNIAGC